MLWARLARVRLPPYLPYPCPKGFLSRASLSGGLDSLANNTTRPIRLYIVDSVRGQSKTFPRRMIMRGYGKGGGEGGAALFLRVGTLCGLLVRLSILRLKHQYLPALSLLFLIQPY